jgi:prepilin-type N-terminal cleavage/methylation domain-containing protein
MNRLRQGFTLLELIVVIAVIGILAAITIIGFSQYQKDTRDARRVSSVNAIHEALEKYYDANGEYPSCSQISAAGVDLVNDTLAGLDQPTVVAPAAPGNTTNSLKCGPTNTLTINGEDFFEYEGDGSAECSGSDSCLAYTLKYKDESSGAVASVASRRTGTVQGAPNLSVTSVNFTTLNANWSSLSNASGYTLQRADNSGFTSGLVTTNLNASTTSYQTTGLTSGQTYYFRVRAESVGGSGNWSATVSEATNALATPVISSATAISNSQINLVWSDIASETGYTLQYTTSSSSWTSPVPTSVSLAANSTSRSVTGLSTGVTYYFRLQATAGGGVTSSWSPNASATTFVPAPTSMTATTNSATQITADWSDVSVATSYTLEYDDNSGFTSPASITAIATSSRAVTGLTQGKTYWFRAYAVVSSTSSTASPSASATTTISGPSSVSVSATDSGTVRAYASGDWIHWFSGDCTCGNWYYAVGTGSGSCASGTTRQMRFGANYTSPTTFRGWSGWGTGTQGFMVSPNSPYGIRFYVQVRCVGTDATSSAVESVSGYVY